jgi:hypothetical protein
VTYHPGKNYVQHGLNSELNTGYNENRTNIQGREMFKVLRKILYKYCSAKENKHINGTHINIYKPIFDVT